VSKEGRRIIAGLKEALRFARGEDTGTRVTVIEVPDDGPPQMVSPRRVKKVPAKAAKRSKSKR
jgi:hypothetical protein